MIAKGLTPEIGAKVFAIMKHPRIHHDREDFANPRRSEPFAIMKAAIDTPTPRPGGSGQRAV
jgi:hypothetical protein